MAKEKGKIKGDSKDERPREEDREPEGYVSEYVGEESIQEMYLYDMTRIETRPKPKYAIHASSLFVVT